MREGEGSVISVISMISGLPVCTLYGGTQMGLINKNDTSQVSVSSSGNLGPTKNIRTLVQCYCQTKRQDTVIHPVTGKWEMVK